jgi:hypothetical protein
MESSKEEELKGKEVLEFEKLLLMATSQQKRYNTERAKQPT